MFRPDCYISALNDYVKTSLELKEFDPDFKFIFDNPQFKTIVINMGSTSNISNSSSMNRIHKNLFQITQKMNLKIKSLNCNFLSVNELKTELKSVQENFLLLKNAHLATKDLINFLKNMSDDLSGKLFIVIYNLSFKYLIF